MSAQVLPFEARDTRARRIVRAIRRATWWRLRRRAVRRRLYELRYELALVLAAAVVTYWTLGR